MKSRSRSRSYIEEKKEDLIQSYIDMDQSIPDKSYLKSTYNNDYKKIEDVYYRSPKKSNRDSTSAQQSPRDRHSALISKISNAQDPVDQCHDYLNFKVEFDQMDVQSNEDSDLNEKVETKKSSEISKDFIEQERHNNIPQAMPYKTSPFVNKLDQTNIVSSNKKSSIGKAATDRLSNTSENKKTCLCPRLKKHFRDDIYNQGDDYENYSNKDRDSNHNKSTRLTFPKTLKKDHKLSHSMTVGSLKPNNEFSIQHKNTSEKKLVPKLHISKRTPKIQNEHAVLTDRYAVVCNENRTIKDEVNDLKMLSEEYIQKVDLLTKENEALKSVILKLESENSDLVNEQETIQEIFENEKLDFQTKIQELEVACQKLTKSNDEKLKYHNGLKETFEGNILELQTKFELQSESLKNISHEKQKLLKENKNLLDKTLDLSQTVEKLDYKLKDLKSKNQENEQLYTKEEVIKALRENEILSKKINEEQTDKLNALLDLECANSKKKNDEKILREMEESKLKIEEEMYNTKNDLAFAINLIMKSKDVRTIENFVNRVSFREG